MHLEALRMRYSQEQDPTALRRAVMMLLSCMASDRQGAGWCVVDDQAPERALFVGERATCVAFVAGFVAAPQTDAGVFNPTTLCVCVDTPARMVVEPEARWGEYLVGEPT
jgi:hypothetical protein